MNSFVALIVSLFAFIPSIHADEGGFYPITETDKKFLAEIVNAVQKGDTAWIVDRMDYPLSIVVSNQTRIVKTKEEFRPILDRELSKGIKTKIMREAKEPLFKNWQGVIVRDGLVWFAEHGESKSDSWEYRIDAIGGFAWQPSEPDISSASGR